MNQMPYKRCQSIDRNIAQISFDHIARLLVTRFTRSNEYLTWILPHVNPILLLMKHEKYEAFIFHRSIFQGFLLCFWWPVLWTIAEFVRHLIRYTLMLVVIREEKESFVMDDWFAVLFLICELIDDCDAWLAFGSYEKQVMAFKQWYVSKCVAISGIKAKEKPAVSVLFLNFIFTIFGRWRPQYA